MDKKNMPAWLGRLSLDRKPVTSSGSVHAGEAYLLLASSGIGAAVGPNW